MSYQLFCGDALAIVPTLQAEIKAVIADPPYYRIVKAEWDQAWTTRAEWIAWLEQHALLWKKALASNGSMLVFGDDEHTAYMQVMLDQHFTFLNNLVWFKTNNLSVKSADKMWRFAPMTERILYYTPQLCKTGRETIQTDLNNFGTLREYFRQYQAAIGLGLKQINARLGHRKVNARLGHRKAEHAFYWGSTQWDLPTAEVYAQLGQEFPVRDFAVQEYQWLWREYQDLRQEYDYLRRTFNARADTFDVITGPIINQNDNTEHPTTKPLWLCRDLIRTITQPGDTVLDPMMGSGSVGVACLLEGRNFIGIEVNEKYFKIAETRLALTAAQPMLLAPVVQELPVQQAELWVT